MPSSAQRAIAAGLNAARGPFGVKVTYRCKGATGANYFTAKVGRTTFEIDDGGTVIETWVSRDYLFDANTLVRRIGREPMSGDEITETIKPVAPGNPSVIKKFTVLAPEGKPVFDYVDAGSTEMKVHTKETQ